MQQRLSNIKNKINILSEELTEIWPSGQRPGAEPATRFDVPKRFYFNMSHMFFPDDFTNVKPHSEADLTDIKVFKNCKKKKITIKYFFLECN